MSGQEMNEVNSSSEEVLVNMKKGLANMEQISFDTVNNADKLLVLIGEARDIINEIKNGIAPGSDAEARDQRIAELKKKLDQLQDTAFTVNNASHELENETLRQKDSIDSVVQMIDYYQSI
ncbi:MAG: hypothetical protein VZR00_02690 [Lachnospiraceae bacterium]|nr:hypothetical protein [Lachnospiraceae bacterium]MEE3460784.1 hypothetical protein [Lachnospiraceae bacterium]